jgi:hypothetical protein
MEVGQSFMQTLSQLAFTARRPGPDVLERFASRLSNGERLLGSGVRGQHFLAVNHNVLRGLESPAGFG